MTWKGGAELVPIARATAREIESAVGATEVSPVRKDWVGWKNGAKRFPLAQFHPRKFSVAAQEAAEVQVLRLQTSQVFLIVAEAGNGRRDLASVPGR